MTEVRIGTPEDVDGVMALILECHQENGFVKANRDKMLQDVWAALTRERGIVGVIGRPGKPLEGCVVLRIGQINYSDEDILEEKLLFVRKEFRVGKVSRAKSLAVFTKQVADTLNMPLVIGVLSNHRTKAKVRLYERVFGDPAGAFFLYGARTDAGIPSVEAAA